MFILLRDDQHVEDFLAIEDDVRDEFFQIGKELKKALKTLFKPDKMNYAALSNTSTKIHVHVVPRYQEPRQFDGLTFIDQRWGKNYAPYDRSFILDESVLVKIRDSIKNLL
jgi:diadenosine tetraphosphate (Ap4A) HIT family hydrolase